MHGGLTEAGPSPVRGTFQAVITALAVLAAVGLFLSSCATGGTGTRDEGPAHVEGVGGATASPSDTPADALDRTEAVRLVKDDPEVSEEVKRELKPCVGDEYPVDVSFGDLTGGAESDVVVNVLTCGDAVGVGSYVYRRTSDRYENVFKTEEPPVYAEMDRGDLVVTKQVYEKGDPVSSPSGENVVTYRWAAPGRFVKEYSWHNDYSGAVDGDGATSVPTPVPVPVPESG
ncbi:hypothetical protein [Streptomyces sp. NPDC003522]